MGKIKACTICKHLGKNVAESTELEASFLYNDIENPASVKIRLCRAHSVQLFKLGQKKFLLHHKQILYDLVNSDEMDFVRILERTLHKNQNSMY
jgi:hypothetical protein